MKTSAEEYLEELKKLQDGTIKKMTQIPSDEPRFIIDSNTRKITIPDDFTFLGVKNDSYAETIWFEIDRYFDAEDLTKHTIAIQYSDESTSGSEYPIGIEPVTDIDIDTVPGKILFGWAIKNETTFKATSIGFAVRIYTIGEDKRFSYSFNTLPSVLPVLDTLDVTGDTVKKYANVLDEWLNRMEEIEDYVSGLNLDDIKEQLNTVQTTVDNTVASVNEIKDDYVNKATYNLEQGNQNDRLDSLQETANRHDREITSISEEQTTQNKNISDNAEHITEVEDKANVNAENIGSTTQLINGSIAGTIGDWKDSFPNLTIVEVSNSNIDDINTNKSDISDLTKKIGNTDEFLQDTAGNNSVAGVVGDWKTSHTNETISQAVTTNRTSIGTNTTEIAKVKSTIGDTANLMLDSSGTPSVAETIGDWRSNFPNKNLARVIKDLDIPDMSIYITQTTYNTDKEWLSNKIDTKADKVVPHAFSIPIEGWQTDTEIAGFSNYIDITIDGMTSNDIVNVNVAPISTGVAAKAQFTNPESFDGYLRLRAKDIPTEAISAQWYIVR